MARKLSDGLKSNQQYINAESSLKYKDTVGLRPIKNTVTINNPITDKHLTSSGQTYSTNTHSTQELEESQACICSARKRFLGEESRLPSVVVTDDSLSLERRKLYPSCNNSLKRGPSNGYIPLQETLDPNQDARIHGYSSEGSTPKKSKHLPSTSSSIEDMLISQEKHLICSCESPDVCCHDSASDCDSLDV